MSFTSDSNSLQTIDSERGMELKVRSGGSDGTKSFQLVSTGDAKEALVGFIAALETKPLAVKDTGEIQDIEEISTWVIMGPDEPGFPLPGHTFDQTINIIRDSLLSYRGLHGMGSEKTKYTVEISKHMKDLLR